jgi:prevent-host-death family protein
VLQLCIIVAGRVGIRELRQNLSVYLRRVAAGERLEVTERGRPVAQLVPLPDAADPISRLALRGRLARRASGRLADLGPPARVTPERPLAEALEAIRDDH